MSATDLMSGSLPDTTPLFVDLDGTLVTGDTLWEGLAALAKTSPPRFMMSVLALSRGRAALKSSVADRVTLGASDLRFNDHVLSFVRAQATKRRVILATAADRRIAEAVAADLGCFVGVIATSDGKNMKGEAKRFAIEAYLKENDLGPAFDYIGDSQADRSVWTAARHAYVVGETDEAAQQIAGDIAIEKVFPDKTAQLRDIIRAMRPHQWAKNGLIFLPLALSQQFVLVEKVLASIIAFLCFSLCASATYFWNDILDIRSDRAHPRKKDRPFASGAISIPHGIGISLALLAISLVTVTTLLSPWVAALFLGYIVITLTYSVYLKEKLLVDAMTLGVLYGYRIVIGAVATKIIVSDWLIAFSVFFFFGLALVKRFSEITSKTPDDSGKIKGRGYYREDRDIISMLGVASSLVSVLIMALFVNSPDVTILYSRPQVLWLVSLVMIYWVSRIWVLAHRGHMPDDPVVFALKDRISILCGLICVGAVVAAV